MYSTFNTIDYIVFAITLAIPAGISIYFGCFGNKQKTATEYLYGSGKLKAIPIGLSLFGSAIPANPLISLVAEVYIFGTQILVSNFGKIPALFLTWKFTLPIFCGSLKLKSPYEYFELRFNSGVRLIMSIVYVIHVTISISLCLFITGIVLSEFTGFKLYVSCIIIGSICTTYTMLGGFKGVIWTDVFQTILTISCVIFTLVKGINIAGGLSKVWSESMEGQRIEFFNLDPNPFIRYSFWSTIIGMTVFSFGYNSGSSCAIQRYLALRNEKEARISTTILALSSLIICFISGLTGLSIYTFYKNCDPVISKKIENPTRLLLYFINQELKSDIGFRGIFTAGILSAGLSTLSAELNALSGVLYYDILQKVFKLKKSDNQTIFIMKGIVLVFGITQIIIAPMLNYFKYFAQLTFTMHSWTCGAQAGVILLATTFPMCNSWGAVSGIFASIFTMAWISINAMYYDLSTPYKLPLSVDNCTVIQNYTLNATRHISSLINFEETPLIYKLSFMYYIVVGMIITILVGLTVSYLTGINDVNKMDPRLIIPCVRPKDSEKPNKLLRKFSENEEVLRNINEAPRYMHPSWH